MANATTSSTGPRPLVTPQRQAELSWRLGDGLRAQTLRREAAQAFSTAPAPDRSTHLWRYSDAASLMPAVLTSSPSPGDAVALPPLLPGGAVAVAQSGLPPRCEVSAEARRQGVQLIALAEAGALLDTPLGALVPASHGLFEALNLATFDGALCLRVPRNIVVTAPIHVVISAATGYSAPRLLVVIEENAEVVVVEEHLGGGSASQVVGVSELFVGQAARLRHLTVQRWDEGTTGHLTARARLDQDANFQGVSVALGGLRSKVDSGVLLAAPGASSELVGVALGDGRQQFDHHTEQRHQAPRTHSTVDFKVAVGGRAVATYTGLIRIEEHAGGSTAYQQNRNLLLTESARAQTIPELEILTDDVSCSHGATVAAVDREQLFYLESRGLPPADALRLVLEGFLDTALQRFPESVRQRCAELVDVRLTSLTHAAP